MNFLRTTSTRRLLTSLLALVAAGIATTAIALAAVGGGPVAAPATLADAIHGSLTGAAVTGVSANVTFTNNLFSGVSFESPDPLLTGASGRLWATTGHLRVELQTSDGDAQIVVDGRSFWVYDPSSKVAYEGALPSQSSSDSNSTDGSSSSDHSVPSVAEIQKQLDKLSTHVDVSAATPTDIGGQPAYDVALTPSTSAGLIGEVRVGFDAAHAAPLDLAVFPRGDSSPALELAASNVSYGDPSPSVFDITPPAGATVERVSIPTQSASNPTAPSADAGQTQTVGTGLGAVIVAKHAAGSSDTSGAGTAGSLPLQTVTINGAKGQQLPTSLGTILAFTRDGTDYLLAGSVTADTLDAVARGL